jgi:hypothetical protein
MAFRSMVETHKHFLLILIFFSIHALMNKPIHFMQAMYDLRVLLSKIAPIFIFPSLSRPTEQVCFIKSCIIRWQLCFCTQDPFWGLCLIVSMHRRCMTTCGEMCILRSSESASLMDYLLLHIYIYILII